MIDVKIFSMVNKYYYKPKNDPTNFGEFLESLNLNKNKIKKMSRLNSSSNFLENSEEFKIMCKKIKDNSNSIKKDLFNKTAVSLYGISKNYNFY